MSIGIVLLLLFVSLLCSAFFSGMEIAFISVNKLDVKLEGNKGTRRGKQLEYFQKRTSRFIGTTLLGNNIALVLFGLLMSNLLEPIFKDILPSSLNGEVQILLFITIISTIIILFAGEFIPKNLFRNNPVGKLATGIIPFSGVYYLLYIPVKMIVALSSFILGADEEEEFRETNFSRVDLQHYMNRMQGKVSDEDELTTNIFSKTLDLSQIKARECIVPRNEIEGVEETATMDEIKQKFIETKFSKLIVYRENIDTPIAYIHHMDILKGLQEPIHHKLSIFPETKAARDILQHFIKTRKSVALIVDEYGGTAGIVTIEDIIEEIFGEIEDEHDIDNPKLIKEKISENEYRFSGRLEIDLLNEEFNLEIPEGDYETIAGFIIENHESIPENDEIINVPPFQFLIEEATRTKIEEVRMFLKEKE